MSEPIDLNVFLEGYKKSEIILGDKKRVFREPAIKDVGLNILEILKKYCLEGNPEEFIRIIENDIPTSKYREFIDKLLNELGLV